MGIVAGERRASSGPPAGACPPGVPSERMAGSDPAHILDLGRPRVLPVPASPVGGLVPPPVRVPPVLRRDHVAAWARTHGAGGRATAVEGAGEGQVPVPRDGSLVHAGVEVVDPDAVPDRLAVEAVRRERVRRVAEAVVVRVAVDRGSKVVAIGGERGACLPTAGGGVGRGAAGPGAQGRQMAGGRSPSLRTAGRRAERCHRGQRQDQQSPRPDPGAAGRAAVDRPVVAGDGSRLAGEDTHAIGSLLRRLLISSGGARCRGAPA